MSYVTLLEAKAHLLVFHDMDDVLIQQNIDAAEVHCASIMNRPRIEDNPRVSWQHNLCIEDRTSEDMVPRSVVQAILLFVGDFYENRTQQVVGTIIATNPSAENLLWPTRIGMGI